MPGMINEEKKVEYLELIYDLIFVFIIGRNNSLLYHIEDGFIPGEVFIAYILCTLAVIQIWNFSTFYMNLYGRNGVRDHVFLFINMYLLYYIAVSISTAWQSSFIQFGTAWMLILANIGVQHIIELRNHKEEPWIMIQLKQKAVILLAEAALVGAAMICYALTRISIVYVPIIFGIVMIILSGKINFLMPVDFNHLSERAMLYVVFTFGEMIISIAVYFTEEITPNSIYFSLMAFLIVAALFLNYEIFYNRIIDKDKITNGMGYMMLHVFLIFALNNISASLGFMRDETVALTPKILFLTCSLMLYFICLFLTGIYGKKQCAFSRRFIAVLVAICAVFPVLMIIFSRMMFVNIAVTVAYAFGIFGMLCESRGRIY